jgi:hypothetical protein
LHHPYVVSIVPKTGILAGQDWIHLLVFHHGNCKSPWLLGNCLVVDCKKCSICHYMLL